MLKDLETRNFKDQYPSNVIQDNVKDLFTQLKNCPFLKGVHLKDVVGDKPIIDVNHKLGRNPLGYIVTKISQPTYPASGGSNDRKISFVIDATFVPATFDVWVF